MTVINLDQCPEATPEQLAELGKLLKAEGAPGYRALTGSHAESYQPIKTSEPQTQNIKEE